jgi:hypothetical protein
MAPQPVFHCTVSSRLSLFTRQGPRPPADPLTTHWPSTNSSFLFYTDDCWVSPLGWLPFGWLLNCCWHSPAQWFLVPSPTGLMTIFYCLTALGAFRPQPAFRLKSKSHYDRRTVGQCVLVSSPVWGSWPDVNYCLTITVLSISGAPSDERSGLSFVLVTW